jgi:hypothetical protein
VRAVRESPAGRSRRGRLMGRGLGTVTPMSKMTRDQYMNLLQSRMDEYIANNPPADNVQKWASQPLLEWFVRDGDEELVDMGEAGA